MRNEAFTVRPLPRLAGDKVAVCPTKSGTGYKTAAHHLAENMGQWVHRWGGYVMTRRQAELFAELYAEGWRGVIVGRGFIPPGGDCIRDALPNLAAVKRYRLAHPPVEAMIAALRRGDVVRFTRLYDVRIGDRTETRCREYDVIANPTDEEVILVSIGRKGIKHWAHGRPSWVNDAELRLLLVELSNTRIVRRRKHTAA
jgi:hypothetical protein